MEWSLPIPKVSGSNPIDYFDNQYLSINLLDEASTVLTLKRNNPRKGELCLWKQNMNHTVHKQCRFSKKNFEAKTATELPIRAGI